MFVSLRGVVFWAEGSGVKESEEKNYTHIIFGWKIIFLFLFFRVCRFFSFLFGEENFVLGKAPAQNTLFEHCMPFD